MDTLKVGRVGLNFLYAVVFFLHWHCILKSISETIVAQPVKVIHSWPLRGFWNQRVQFLLISLSHAEILDIFAKIPIKLQQSKLP